MQPPEQEMATMSDDARSVWQLPRRGIVPCLVPPLGAPSNDRLMCVPVRPCARPCVGYCGGRLCEGVGHVVRGREAADARHACSSGAGHALRGRRGPQRRPRAPGARRERGENVAEGHGAQGQEPVVRSDAGRHTGRDGGLDGGLPNGVEEAEASEGEAVGDDNGDGWSAAAKRASGRAYVARPRLATKIGRRGWARTARREPSSSPTAPAWKISTQVCSPPNCAPHQARSRARQQSLTNSSPRRSRSTIYRPTACPHGSPPRKPPISPPRYRLAMWTRVPWPLHSRNGPSAADHRRRPKQTR